MSLKDDIKDDWQLMDGVEDVTLVPKNPSGASITGVKALMQELTAGQVAYLGGTFGINPDSVIWDIWDSPALIASGNARPLESWEIVSATKGTFIIVHKSYSDLTSRTKCTCNRKR